MDIVSSAASVIAIVQLSGSIKQLVEFGKAIQDAPANVNKLFRDLELLDLVVIQARNISHILTLNNTAERAIRNCEGKISSLLQKLSKAKTRFQSGNLIQRKWSALKITLKSDEIDSLQRSIEEAKSTLQIVQNNTLLECFLSVDRKQKQTLAEIDIINQLVQKGSQGKIGPEKASMHIHSDQHSELVVALSYDPGVPIHCIPGSSRKTLLTLTSEIECKSPNSSSHEVSRLQNSRSLLHQKRSLQESWRRTFYAPLFSVHTESRTYNVRLELEGLETKPASESETRTLVLPNAGGRFIGLRYGMLIYAKSTMGWKHTIQPFRLVPDDSLVFEFCRTGNVEGLRALFKCSHASPWDRNSNGRTPLWIAAQALQPEIAKVLLQEGANPNDCDWKSNAEPISGIVEGTPIAIEAKLAMIRILRSHPRAEVDPEILLSIAGRSLVTYRPQHDIAMAWAERQDAISRLLPALFSDLHFEHHLVAELFFIALLHHYEQKVLRWMLHNWKGGIETEDGRNNVLYEAMATNLITKDWVSMRAIVLRTKYLHRQAKADRRSERRETVTAQAMRDMSAFLLWRAMLSDIGIDMGEFVRNELEVEGEGLASQGWNERSLGRLLRDDVESGLTEWNGRRFFGFPVCERCGEHGVTTGMRLNVDLLWRWRLRCLRRENFESNVAANSVDEAEARGDRAEMVARSLPYRMVCSFACSDGVCVAWAFEDDGERGDEPVFPPFPMVVEVHDSGAKNEDVEDEELEVCPTRGMPGAFVD